MLGGTNTTIGGGKGGREVTALCTYDTKDIKVGEKVLLNPNRHQKGQYIRTFVDNDMSSPVLFTSDSERFINDNKIYMRHGNHFDYVLDIPSYAVAEIPNKGALFFQFTNNVMEWRYYENDNGIGYKKTSISIQTLGTSEPTDNQIVKAWVSNNGNHIYLYNDITTNDNKPNDINSSDTTNGVYKINYDLNGNVTGFTKLTGVLQQENDLNTPAVVMGDYLYTSNNPCKIYKVDNSTNTYTYLKDSGVSIGENPVPFGNYIISSDKLIDTTDKENLTYQPIASVTRLNQITSYTISGNYINYSMLFSRIQVSGDIRVYKDKFHDGQVERLDDNSFIAQDPNTKELFDINNALVQAENTYQSLGYKKVNDLGETIEDYSSPKQNNTYFSYGQYLVDNDRNLYNITHNEIWSYTEGDKLIHIGAMPNQNINCQDDSSLAYRKLFNKPAYSKYASGITQLSVYPSINLFKTGFTSGEIDFNNEGYVISGVNGDCGKFEEDGTFTPYTIQGGGVFSTSSMCSVMYHTVPFALVKDVSGGWFSASFDPLTKKATFTKLGQNIGFAMYNQGDTVFTTSDDKYLFHLIQQYSIFEVFKINPETHLPDGNGINVPALSMDNSKAQFCLYDEFNETISVMVENGNYYCFKYDPLKPVNEIESIQLDLIVPTNHKITHEAFMCLSPNMNYAMISDDTTHNENILIFDRQVIPTPYSIRAERYRGSNTSNQTVSGIVIEEPKKIDDDMTVRVLTVALPTE